MKNNNLYLFKTLFKRSRIQFTLRNLLKIFLSLSANLSKKICKLMETSEASKKLLPVSFPYICNNEFFLRLFSRLEIVNKKLFQFFPLILKMFCFSLKMVVKFHIFPIYRFSNFLFFIVSEKILKFFFIPWCR